MTASPAKANARVSARRKIFQPGEMIAAGIASRVHLLDLSCTGALVYADQAPAVGTIVRLACPMPLGAARVAWTRAKRFGVAFTTPLQPAMLDEVIARQPSLNSTDALVIR